MQNIIEPGDVVRDPLDGEFRRVSYIDGKTVFLSDGGCMGLDECSDVYLPSEAPLCL